MKELVGRLTALDPEASESLKVIGYFDALVAGGVGVEALLRGAAALSGVPAGFASASRRFRIGPDGGRLTIDEADVPPAAVPSAGAGRAAADAGPAGGRPTGMPRADAPGAHGAVATPVSRRVGPDGIVWIERLGAPHANDAMVLERLAIAVDITTARRAADGTGAVETAVNPHATADERGRALARLRLDGIGGLRAVAFPADGPFDARSSSAIVATPHGLARAVIVRADEAGELVRTSATDAAPHARSPRVGIGLTLAPERLPESWASALIALRLSCPDEPVVDSADLGALLLFAEAADEASALHPDAAALAALDERSRAVLDALADAGSVRAAAERLGMHHSSVQARAATLAGTLGYDPRTTRGRTRYALARTILTLAAPAG